MTKGHVGILSGLGVVLAAGVAAVGCTEWEGVTLESKTSSLTTLYNSITQAGNESRIGWYDNQPGLDPAIVASASFVKVFDIALPLTPGEQVYAQPLVWNNRVVVVTQANNLYLVDANSNSGTIVASRGFGEGAYNATSIGCGDITPTVGTTGTPVIDNATNTAYFFTKSSAGVWRLRGIDLTSPTLAERPGFPVTISGAAQNQPAATFNSTHQLQRPGVLLMNGVVYGAFGAHCDIGSYKGWIIGVGAYQAPSAGQILTRYATMASSGTSRGAGIWMSGAGIASDRSGDILYSTGNTFTSTPYPGPIVGTSPPADQSEAVVRLRLNGTSFTPIDFFAPFNAGLLNNGDSDLGSGGVILLPSQFGTTSVPNTAVVAGKGGTLYFMNRDSLGGYQQGTAGGDRVLSSVSLGGSAATWSRPAAWPGNGGFVYQTVNGGVFNLQVFQKGVSGTNPILTQVATAKHLVNGVWTTTNFGAFSGSPIVTSNGMTNGSAVVWVTRNTAELRAYRAVPVGDRIESIFAGGFGNNAKFTTVGVGNNRIFIGTGAGRLVCFGTTGVAPVSGGPLDFGVVNVGTPRQLTLSITANSTLTVNSITSSNSQFTVGTISDATMSSGQVSTVPVTFTPTAAGVVSAVLTVNTSNGPGSITVSGQGQSTSAVLTVAPTQLNFGGVPSGGNKTLSITLTNTGASTLTFAATTPPTAPFSATGIPANGATLGAGQSITANVTFSPTSAASYNRTLTFNSNGGNRAVALVGISGTAGHLVITPAPPATLAFGSVAVGSSTTLPLTLQNTGDLDLTLTLSKLPSPPFSVTPALVEGAVIAGHATVNVTARFAPTSAGSFSTTWELNDNTVQQTVPFTGTGTGSGPPVLPRTGWVASASNTGGADVPANAIDASLTSRWSTGVVMAANMYFQVDMGTAQTVSQIRMDSSNGDHARAFSVYVTNNPANLGAAVATGTAAATPVIVPFTAKSGRYIRVVLGAIPAGTTAWWSIQDFNAYGTSGGGGFPIRINFQPAASAVPAGYSVDGGDVYGVRSGGLSYGWNTSHTALTRDRNINADQRLDTLCHFHAAGVWEVAVPNGTYNVFVSIGDAGFASTHTLNVEGVSYWSALPLAANAFASTTRSVTVSDGRLTINQGSAGEMATRINYVEISQ